MKFNHLAAEDLNVLSHIDLEGGETVDVCVTLLVEGGIFGDESGLQNYLFHLAFIEKIQDE